MDFSPDFSIFYSDFADPVIWSPKGGGASVTGRALYRRPGEGFFNDALLGQEHTLRYPLATFPDVRKGDTFRIAGVDYIARENPQPRAAGQEAVVPLIKVA